MLSALAIQYADRAVAHRGPTFESAVQLTPAGAVLGFAAGTAFGLHLAGTAACRECCAISPFSVMSANGTWARAPASVRGAEVFLSAAAPILGIRLEWEGYPQCALYNGVGGPDSHTALAAPPFQWCAFGTPFDQPPWIADCSPHDPLDVYFPEPRVPSSSITDFTFGGGAGVAGIGRKDAHCSGVNIRSGNPGAVGLVTNRHAIVGSAAHSIDAISLSFRYIAGFTPAPPANLTASTVTVLLTDAKGVVLRTLLTTPPLGDYQYSPFTRFSPPIPVHATDLRLQHEGKIFLALRVDNHQRNLQIPIDDQAGGWNVTVTWGL